MKKCLDLFLNHFLSDDSSDIELLILEQSDDNRRFNIGKLINVGFDLFKKNQKSNSIYMFHPVDFIPKKFNQYFDFINKVPKDGILCVCDNEVVAEGFETTYKACVYTNYSMEKTNGYPNGFWAWGAEDMCFLSRIDYLKIERKFIDFGPTLARDIDNPSPDRLLENYWESDKHCPLENIMNDGLTTLDYKILNTEIISPNLKKIIVEL